MTFRRAGSNDLSQTLQYSVPSLYLAMIAGVINVITKQFTDKSAGNVPRLIFGVLVLTWTLSVSSP